MKRALLSMILGLPLSFVGCIFDPMPINSQVSMNDNSDTGDVPVLSLSCETFGDSAIRDLKSGEFQRGEVAGFQIGAHASVAYSYVQCLSTKGKLSSISVPGDSVQFTTLSQAESSIGKYTLLVLRDQAGKQVYVDFRGGVITGLRSGSESRQTWPELWSADSALGMGDSSSRVVEKLRQIKMHPSYSGLVSSIVAYQKDFAMPADSAILLKGRWIVSRSILPTLRITFELFFVNSSLSRVVVDRYDATDTPGCTHFPGPYDTTGFKAGDQSWWADTGKGDLSLTDSWEFWKEIKKTHGASYRYFFASASWVGVRWYTTVSVVNDSIKTITRRILYNRGMQSSVEDRTCPYVEEVIQYDTLSASRKEAYLTVDQMYAYAKSTLLDLDTTKNTIYVKLHPNGLLRQAQYYPHGCMDDCVFGPKVDSLAFGAPSPLK